MKKLVLVLALGVLATTNNMHAQSIVLPVEVDVTVIDRNATEILLVNRSTGDVLTFATANDFYAAYPTLEAGVYRIRYTVDGERYKQYINISSSERRAVTTFSFSSSRRR